MKNTWKFIFASFIFVSSFLYSFRSLSAPPIEEERVKNRNKIEELFVWKISDELRLNDSEEKKIRQIVKDISERKNKVNQEMESLTEKKIEKKEAEKAVKNYKKHLEDYNKIGLDELEQVTSAIGLEKTYHYLRIKTEVMNKLKSLLSNKSQKLDEPKVIEE